MFTFNGETLILNETGQQYTIPEGTKCVAVDSDGEIYAFENTAIYIDKDVADPQAWMDGGEGFTFFVGRISQSMMDESGTFFKKWRESKVIAKEPEKKFEDIVKNHGKPEVLDGSKLRAKVTEIVDRSGKRGEIGAGRARHLLRDLGSEGFTFENYRTADLILICTHIGFDMKLTRDYIAFRRIDDAVFQARGEL